MITDEDVTIEEKRQYLLDCGYPARAIARLDDAAVEQWVKDELEEQAQEPEDRRSDYEKYPLDTAFGADQRWM